MPIELGDGIKSFMGLPYKESQNTYHGKGLTKDQDEHYREMVKYDANRQTVLYPKGRYSGLESSSSIMLQDLPYNTGGYTTHIDDTIYLNHYSTVKDPINTAIHENAHLEAGGKITKEMWEALRYDDKFINRLKEAKEKFGIKEIGYRNEVTEREFANDFETDPWAELAVIQAQAPVGVALHETEVGKFIFKGFPKQKAAMLMLLSPKKSKGIQESTPYLQEQFPSSKDSLYEGESTRNRIRNFINDPKPVINIGETLKKFLGVTKE